MCSCLRPRQPCPVEGFRVNAHRCGQLPQCSLIPAQAEENLSELEVDLCLARPQIKSLIKKLEGLCLSQHCVSNGQTSQALHGDPLCTFILVPIASQYAPAQITP